MNNKVRREEIKKLLLASERPVSGGSIAKQFQVSRQVVVQDIALLRANGLDIISTNRGYVLHKEKAVCTRVFKVCHTEAQSEEEMNLVVDLGGRFLDVFVYHRAYGLIRTELKISSRLEVAAYIDDISTGKSRELLNITSGYHYHTIEADSEEILDLIQEKLQEKGFLARLSAYEPVDFQKQAAARTAASGMKRDTAGTARS
ncbi:MAG: transcription repressor NadR [Eubacterium sp.]